MSDDLYDDDFYSDEDTKGGTLKSSSQLMPIVEVPSDMDTARSASVAETSRTETTETHRSYGSDDDDYSEDDDEDVDETPRTGRSTRRTSHKKKRGKNGKVGSVDMTPPEKLLKKSEKRARRYADHPKKHDQAILEYIRCTAYARIVYGDGHWKLANTYANLAQAYYDLKSYYPQCQLHAEFAKNMMVSGVQLSSSPDDRARMLRCLIKIYFNLGRSYTQMKKYSEAEAALTKAEKLSRERSKIDEVSDDETDEWNIKIFTAIARLNARQKKFAVAQTYFEKVLNLTEQVHGRDSKELINVYQSLGRVEQGKGDLADHERAIEHFLQAHSIANATYKDQSPAIADTARVLAEAYTKVGVDNALTSAESYLNDCIAIYQAHPDYGPYHTTTIEVQDELARLMIRDDRQEEGITMLKSTIEAKKELYGDLCGEIAETWKLIGNVHLSQSETEKALRALKKCHNIECSVYGTNHRKSKDTQRTIDILLANPHLKSKLGKSKSEQLAERPRFNSTIKAKSQLGGFKPQ